MNLTSIGDLAQSMLLRSRGSQLKQTISTLTQELSSGQTAEIGKRVGSDFSYLGDIDRNLARLDGYDIATSEADMFTTAAQNSLGRVHEITTRLSGAILGGAPSSIESVRSSLAANAQGELESTISTMNASIAGRSLFGGIATDRAPLEDASVLLDELRNAFAGLTTSADIDQAARDWFADPAGFETLMYMGDTEELAPIQLGAGEQISMSLKADDQVFRDMLRNMAVAALSTDPTLGLSVDTQNELLRTSGEGLLSDQDQVVAIQSDLGAAQAHVEQANVRNATARSGLEQARNSLLEVDPFDTATRLEEVQFQLESLYAVTVRTSRLSLLSYLR